MVVRFLSLGGGGFRAGNPVPVSIFRQPRNREDRSYRFGGTGVVPGRSETMQPPLGGLSNRFPSLPLKL